MATHNKTFVLHDETINTYGFRMLTAGANLEEFRKNPVMLLNHNDYTLPIGRWENIRIEGTQILAEAHFDMADEKAREVARKVDDGFIKAASIGAWPPEEQSNDPYLMLQGQKLPTVTKWTVREASICTIGANHNALAFYDRQTHERIDLQKEDAATATDGQFTYSKTTISHEPTQPTPFPRRQRERSTATGSHPHFAGRPRTSQNRKHHPQRRYRQGERREGQSCQG